MDSTSFLSDISLTYVHIYWAMISMQIREYSCSRVRDEYNGIRMKSLRKGQIATRRGARPFFIWCYTLVRFSKRTVITAAVKNKTTSQSIMPNTFITRLSLLEKGRVR